MAHLLMNFRSFAVIIAAGYGMDHGYFSGNESGIFRFQTSTDINCISLVSKRKYSSYY